MDRAHDESPISSLKKIGLADLRRHSGDVILFDENQQGYIPPRAFIRVTYPESIGEVTSLTLQTILDNIGPDRTDFMDQYQWTLKSHTSPASSNNKSGSSPPFGVSSTGNFCWTNPVCNVPGGQKIEPAYYLKKSAETILVEMWHNIKPHENPEVNLDVIANQVGQHVLDGLAKDMKDNYNVFVLRYKLDQDINTIGQGH